MPVEPQGRHEPGDDRGVDGQPDHAEAGDQRRGEGQVRQQHDPGHEGDEEEPDAPGGRFGGGGGRVELLGLGGQVGCRPVAVLARPDGQRRHRRRVRGPRDGPERHAVPRDGVAVVDGRVQLHGQACGEPAAAAADRLRGRVGAAWAVRQRAGRGPTRPPAPTPAARRRGRAAGPRSARRRPGPRRPAPPRRPPPAAPRRPSPAPARRGPRRPSRRRPHRARRGVERDRGGRGDVERVDVAGHRDADPDVGGGERLVGQPRALRAEQEGDALGARRAPPAPRGPRRASGPRA